MTFCKTFKSNSCVCCQYVRRKTSAETTLIKSRVSECVRLVGRRKGGRRKRREKGGRSREKGQAEKSIKLYTYLYSKRRGMVNNSIR